MPFALLKYGLNPRYRDPPQLNWPSEIKNSYDVIIIGAGGHGLAVAVAQTQQALVIFDRARRRGDDGLEREGHPVLPQRRVDGVTDCRAAALALALILVRAEMHVAVTPGAPTMTIDRSDSSRSGCRSNR